MWVRRNYATLSPFWGVVFPALVPSFGWVVLPRLNRGPNMFSLRESYYVYKVRTSHDEQAFARLYDEYVKSIYRFVYSKISSKEQAEDVTSETFLRFWNAIQRGEEIRHVRGMLYRIARHLIIDVYRRRQTASIVGPVTFQEDETSTDTEALLSDAGKASRAMEAQADVALLMEQVGQLKEDYQDVLMLRLVEDLSFQDIAEALGKQAGAVRVLYHRALKSLQRLQDGSGSDSPPIS